MEAAIDTWVPGEIGEVEAGSALDRRSVIGNTAGCRRHQETLGQGQSRSCHGGQGPAATHRQGGCQENADKGFTKSREEGGYQASEENRRDSCCSGSDRLAPRSRRFHARCERPCSPLPAEAGF